MNICLLTQDGMTKTVTVPKNFGEYYEEFFIRWDERQRAKAWSHLDAPIEFAKTKKRVFKRHFELASGLWVFTELPNELRET